MPFQFHINIIDLILKGILIGIIASAPMGPVGVLCVQRTLNKGRWYGFITGVGAVFSDFIYALLTGLGMSFMLDFISNPSYKFLIQLSSSIILLLFGLYCFKSNPTKNMHQSGNSKGTLLHNGITAFLVTFSNPMIMFLFIFLYGLFAFSIPSHPFEMSISFLSIVLGALLWWFGLTWLVDKIRGKFDDTGILIINKVIGSVVIIFSLIVFFGTAFNLYHLPHL